MKPGSTARFHIYAEVRRDGRLVRDVFEIGCGDDKVLSLRGIANAIGVWQQRYGRQPVTWSVEPLPGAHDAVFVGDEIHFRRGRAFYLNN